MFTDHEPELLRYRSFVQASASVPLMMVTCSLSICAVHIKYIQGHLNVSRNATELPELYIATKMCSVQAKKKKKCIPAAELGGKKKSICM